MLEIIILVAFTSFVILPFIGDQLIGAHSSYKDCWILGNGLVFVLGVVCLVILLILISFYHVFYDSKSIVEIFNELTI